MFELRDYQEEAIRHLGSGKILWGGVGSGKSAAALGYYMKAEQPKDIYVITTAKKRDSGDWPREAARFGIGTERDSTVAGVLTVDSWNNSSKYRDVVDAFFIFDEQRVVGSGVWVTNFLKIAKRNDWILLSATPGDTWTDYGPIFVANGFYRNLTDFREQHIEWKPFVKYPQIKGFKDVGRLQLLRNQVLVEMPYDTEDRRRMNWLPVGYNQKLFDRVYRDRWHVYEDRPITDIAELFRVMRKVVNSDPSRLQTVRDLMKVHPRIVIFYNFNYELDLLRTFAGEIKVAELNGHKHDPVPDDDRWLYLVQYVAGSEAWNCTSTDAMILFSLTYSYKNFMQAMGRIDRMDTNFQILFYYILRSDSVIDRAVSKSLQQKKSFNEVKFVRESPDYQPSEEERLTPCE